MTKIEFINPVSKLINEENKKRNYPLYTSVVLAQACLETGYGQSQRMMKSNAIFGIKAGKNWKGKVYNSKTKECYNAGEFTEINDCFRAYNSLQESIKDYFDLICNNSRYRKAINCKTPKECITAIKQGGYATDPSYITKIMNIIENNNFYKYDNNNIFNFRVNCVYTTLVDLKVRAGAGMEFRQKNKSELTEKAKKHSKIGIKAVLKAGTKVTCLMIVKKGNELWIKIPSGFICAKMNDRVYVR